MYTQRLLNIQRNGLAGSSEVPRKLIGYITDIEGNLQFWYNYLKISYVLRQDESGTIRLRENCHFIFGGDVCDRGTGDLRVVNDLIRLKRDYPDRVHFILGNRDINKLRIPFELCDDTLKHKGNVYWIKSVPNTGNTRAEKMKWV